MSLWRHLALIRQLVCPWCPFCCCCQTRRAEQLDFQLAMTFAALECVLTKLSLQVASAFVVCVLILTFFVAIIYAFYAQTNLLQPPQTNTYTGLVFVISVYRYFICYLLSAPLLFSTLLSLVNALAEHTKKYQNILDPSEQLLWIRFLVFELLGEFQFKWKLIFLELRIWHRFVH